MVQTHDFVLGLAHMGEKYGLRCAKEDEEKLHSLLHPSVTWVDRAKVRVFEAGPWPHGTQRPLRKHPLALDARPLQPCPGHKGGIWYTIEAECSFHEVPARAPSVSAPPAVLASQRTLRDMQPASASRAAPDPLQFSDPWQVALSQRQGSSKALEGPTTIAEAMKSIRQHEPGASCPACSCFHRRARLAAAQEGFQSQFGVLDSKIQPVSSKVDSQEAVLQNLLQQQMNRIEELMGATKKVRQE